MCYGDEFGFAVSGDMSGMKPAEIADPHHRDPHALRHREIPPEQRSADDTKPAGNVTSVRPHDHRPTKQKPAARSSAVRVCAYAW